MHEELSKKLAEWAGFKWVDEDRYMKGVPGALFHGYWTRPAPEEWGWGSCPDFPSSLDACFKWPVPKVLEEYNIEYYSFKQDTGLYYSEVNIWKKGDTRNGFEILQDQHIAKCFKQGDNLEKVTALALCLAIEKLIDRGG